MAGQILVIEDEPGIVDFLERGLRAHGFGVISALDGESGLERAGSEPVDLVVLDMMLPGRSGLEVLESLRTTHPSLPVIVLTALGDVENRVAGLDAGAADYLAKPFSLNELAARIRAQLRMAAQVPQTLLSAGGVEVDLLTREVHRDGQPVRLSTTEFELLTYLMRNRGQVLSREQILRAVWGYEYDPGTNVVDVYVGYLRRKLRGPPGRSTPDGDGDTRSDTPITTIRSVGYRFDAPQ
ncbi:MAG TPA: response regulator transcription factor [Solirubrobacteraceae bacterium]|nr:response regulator transcription factor [Solirubrobacteraceae bacterium]